MRTLVTLLVAAAASNVGFTPCASAQSANQPQLLPRLSVHQQPYAESKAGPHGGTLKTVGNMQTETVITPGGLKVYLYSADGKPLSAERGRGAATLAVEGGEKRYRYDLFPAEDGTLAAPVDLSRIAGRQITVDYQLVGLSRQPISYRDVAVVPADQMQQDAVAIARQKVCPVSGKPLGSMGDPVSVQVNAQRLFVCCQGCVNAVKANPAKYIQQRPSVEIAKLTQADAPLIEKQARCPVMDEPLGSMGAPVKLLVGGQPLYLCCKGCVKKVQAEPEKYLAMIQQNSGVVSEGTEAVRPGVFKVTNADAPFIAAQKRCPVMDEPLDAMGGPYKVHAAGRAIYICCPGCAKKIAAEPDKYLALLQQQGIEAPQLQAASPKRAVPAGKDAVRPGVFKVTAADAPYVAAQKKCPVMDEPLDAMGGPYKVHAAGRAIYICCPGCAKRIAAEPDKYLAILEANGVNPPVIR